MKIFQYGWPALSAFTVIPPMRSAVAGVSFELALKMLCIGRKRQILGDIKMNTILELQKIETVNDESADKQWSTFSANCNPW
jgi:hypothetical protein